MKFLKYILISIILITLTTQTVLAKEEFIGSSIVVNQTNLVYGDEVSFTITYPSEAARQVRQCQYPGSPQTQINCYLPNSSTQIGLDLVFPDTKERLNGGWRSVTNSHKLGVGAVAGQAWPINSMANCSATLFYYDVKGTLNILAATSFQVAAVPN